MNSDVQDYVARLNEMLEAAKANLVKYEASDDERAISAGRVMVAGFEKAIAAFG
jgi:hypothetical protein